MKTRLFFFILFIVFCYPLLGQVENDSTQFQEIHDEKIYKIEQWEKQIKSAQERGDLHTEMLAMMELISFKMNDFGDRTSTYEDLRYLERLVEKNPNERAVKRIEVPLNKLLGYLLMDQSKMEEALVYYKKAIDLSVKYDLYKYYNDASIHHAELQALLGRREEAFDEFRKLEREAIQNKDSLIQNRVYESMSGVYLSEENIDSALYYAKKSIDNFSPANQIAFRNLRVAECYLILEKELDSVIFYAETGLKLAKQSLLEREQMIAHNYLADAFGIIGEYEQAYFHFIKFYDLEQKQRSFEAALEIGNVNLEQEKEASLLQQELSEERLSNQRLVIWIVSGGLFLLAIGLIYIFRQLKFIRKQNKIIEQEKLRAEQSERYKEQFLANMSHEIRTPMHAISGMVNALRRREHTKEQAAYLEAMKISSNNLLVILNDVLDMSKIESGNLEIASIPMDPVEAAKNVINLLSYKAEEKGLMLTFRSPKGFPKVVQGDPVRLNQILVNLVGNAIKFTEKGSVEITLTKSRDNYKFKIQDTGIGISEEVIDTIFNSFKQGENALVKKHEGTGLGLSISKKLIELQNGQISVKSEQGKGSKFCVKLPLVEPVKNEELKNVVDEAQLKAIGQSLKGLRLLVAEDNSFNVMVVKDDLTWFIPEVSLTFVENGKDAIEKYKEEIFDAVLMDVQMPELNGYDATMQIRQLEANAKTKRTPIVAMTASLLKDQIDKCFDAGMDAYIPKPYKQEELITTIKSVLKWNGIKLQ